MKFETFLTFVNIWRNWLPIKGSSEADDSGWIQIQIKLQNVSQTNWYETRFQQTTPLRITRQQLSAERDEKTSPTKCNLTAHPLLPSGVHLSAYPQDRAVRNSLEESQTLA